MNNSLILERLNERDKKVLESIFAPFGGANLSASNIDIEADLKDSPEINNLSVNESKRLELEAVKLGEEGKLDEALEVFEKAIFKAPQRCSVYNNKAQVLRFRGNDAEAMKNLNKALELSSPKQARTRCQALCQRGLLYRKMENITAAKNDFEEAALLGSKFARNQLIEINPYSALCNQMLQAAFQNLQ